MRVRVPLRQWAFLREPELCYNRDMEKFLGKRNIDNDSPGQEIGIRTMGSDIKAIRASGGETANVQSPNFSGKQGIGSEEPVFIPKANFPEESPVVNGNSSGRKIIWMVVGAFAIGVVFSAFGYFVVFPLLLK